MSEPYNIVNQQTYSMNTQFSYVTNPVTLTLTPVAPPPAPMTEVERLLADVEAVCALGR